MAGPINGLGTQQVSSVSNTQAQSNNGSITQERTDLDKQENDPSAGQVQPSSSAAAETQETNATDSQNSKPSAQNEEAQNDNFTENLGQREERGSVLDVVV